VRLSRYNLLSEAWIMKTETPRSTQPRTAGGRGVHKPHNDLNEFVGNPNFVLSLARGLKVIEAFDTRREGLTVADVARHTGFSRAAARRLLLTLELLGYAEARGRVFRLKTSILNLGFSYLSSSSLPTIAQPVLEGLTEVLHESSSMSVLDGDQIVYVARSAMARVMSIGVAVGTRLPAFCTSMGRVMLAALPEEEFAGFLERVELKAFTPRTVTDKPRFVEIIQRVGAEGYALVDEELELGLRSIAVPVTAADGRVAAAINVGVHAARFSLEEMIHRILPHLRKSAQSLGRSISGI
jgi:IclR family transcriptional regulator, pca regulon regulatory protein